MTLPTLLLRADPQRRDWYLTDAWIEALGFLPGIGYQPARGPTQSARARINRTHLPILESLYTLVFATRQCEPTYNHTAEGVTLRPHQIDAVKFIQERRGTLLAMEMRTGKTGAAIYAHDPESGPLMVVAPLAVRSVWCAWMQKRWPNEQPLIVTGTQWEPNRYAGAKLIFVHYDILAKHESLGFRPGTFVLDEVHLLSNSKARRTTTMLMMATLAHKVVALTGTPLWNKPQGLHSILGACNPGAWGNKYAFGNRYAGPEKTPYGTKYTGSSNEEELQARLTEVMFARTWKDVAPHLPPVVRAVETVAIDAKTTFELDLLATIARGDQASLGIGETARFRLVLGHAKAAYGRAVAQQTQRDGHHVVVWVHHREVARSIAKGCANVYVVTGEQPEAIRAQALAAWQESQEPAILVISLAVGQVGIDLSHAHHAIFVENDFTPAVMAQAEARTFSPDRPMSALYLAADHQVDKLIIDALVNKTETARGFGLPAPDAMDVFTHAFEIKNEEGNLDRLLAAFLKMPDELDSNYE